MGQIVKNYYTLVLTNNRVGIYSKIENQDVWENVLINGESWSKVHSQQELTKLVLHFTEDLSLTDNLKSCAMVILYEKQYISLLNNISNILSDLQCIDWQVLSWELVAKRANLTALQPDLEQGWINQEWLKKSCLPVLDTLLGFQEQSWQTELNRAKHQHVESMDSLRMDRQHLEQELEMLKKHIKALQKPSMEHLLTYLPIIYRNFWMQVKPQDLALLAGTYDVPQIESPYPEPASDTIAIMKKRLQNLPTVELQQLKDFCQEMVYRNLSMRPEMKFLLEE